MGTRWLVTGTQGFIGRYLGIHPLFTVDASVLGIGRSEYLKDSFTHSVSGPAGPTPATLPDLVRVEKLIAANIGGTRALFQAICGSRGKRPKVVIGSTAVCMGIPQLPDGC